MSLIQKELVQENQEILRPKIKDVDKICSSYLSFQNPKFAEIDGIYFSSLFVIHFTREMESEFLKSILALDLNVQISMFYDKRNSYEIMKELTYRIGNAGASIKTTYENQQDFEILGGVYEDAKYIRKQLQMGEEDLFDYTLYLGTYADTLEELERNLQRIESAAIGVGLTTVRSNYRQEVAFYSMLPFLKNDEEISQIASRNVLTSGLVSTYPFISNALYDEKGVLIGVNSFDKSLVLLNRFDTQKYKNANMFVVGTSGSGKSYFVKLLLNRNRLLNIQQFVIDPDREYEMIAKKLEGAVIKFGAKQVINLMEIRETYLDSGESYLQNKLTKLRVFFSMIFPNLTEEEKSLLEEKVIECYAEKGIFEDNESLYEISEKSKVLQSKKFKGPDKMPILEDLWKIMKKEKKLKNQVAILKTYINGSMSFLNQKTNINIENKIIVVDIYEMSEEALPIVMFIITDFFWDKIQKNREQKKILYLDEVWKMIHKNPQTADFVFKLFKTIRKYGGAATAITQDVGDFFFLEDGKYGKGILNNSSIKCLFQLEENEINTLEKVMLLSEEEKSKLLNMPRGTALIHAGRNRLMVDVIASEKEHIYITTEKNENKKGDFEDEENFNSIRECYTK